MNTTMNASNTQTRKIGRTGVFVLENAQGQVVRTFAWEGEEIIVIVRHDNRRVETHATLEQLNDEGIGYDVLAQTNVETLKAQALEIGQGRGRLVFVDSIATFAPEHELGEENAMKTPAALGWSIALQAGLAGLFLIAGVFTGSQSAEKKEVSVTILPQEVVEKMLESEKVAATTPPKEVMEKAAKHVVVAPSETKIDKHAPIPTKSTGKHVANKAPRGGGYKGPGPRGYGTNEPNMNSIGALGALNNAPRVKGGNGGAGGVNLQAVGTEPGSGAGGKGHGGFGSNGAGGRGRGGLGKGSGQGLANAMYGKGLIAAPFGDGGAAPGSGGYGTRGKMGGGAQGAGYGTETVVGSWKGTGPKGDGPAGSGVGNGDPNGSPWGASDGEGGDAIVTGGLDRDQIEQVIRRNIGQITYCYEQGLQKEPNLAGRVTVKFQIAGSGHVSIASVKDSSVRSVQVEGCIVSKLRNWTFPKPHGGVNVAVVYPFALRRTVSMR